nr:hypothetical protein [Tanacetum cinerariifolium]
MGDTVAQIRSERVSKLSNDSLLVRALKSRVLDLEQTKTTQANEIDSLKRRVKKLKKKQRLRTYNLKRLYKVGLTAKVKSLDNEQSLGEDASKQERINLDGEEVFVAKQDENVVEKEVDAAQVQAKAKGIVFHEPEESTTKTTAIIPKSKSENKGKAIMIEEPGKEKAQKEEEEANIALIETWDDVQAKINIDHQLAERLQVEEQQELTNEEKATLLCNLGEKKKVLCSKESRRKEEQTTNINSTKKNHVYLPQECRREEAHRFEEQVF